MSSPIFPSEFANTKAITIARKPIPIVILIAVAPIVVLQHDGGGSAASAAELARSI